MIASCVVNCLVTFRHLGCILYDGCCSKRCTKCCSNSAYLRPGEVWQRRCIDLIDLFSHCWVAIQSLYKALYVHRSIRTSLCIVILCFPERTELWRYSGALQRRCSNNANEECSSFFPSKRCTSRSMYNDSYSAQGQLCATFQSDVTSF